MVTEESFVNCYRYDFNLVNQVKKGDFQGILQNYPEPRPEAANMIYGSADPESELEPKEIISAPQHCQNVGNEQILRFQIRKTASYLPFSWSLSS
jgi:hypothetical protein